jgi:hypothetical protein
MNDQIREHERLFEERRQALGLLVSLWTSALAGILAMTVFVFGTPLEPLGSFFFVVLALALVAGMVWGWRARSGISRDHVRAVIDERDIRWWERDTFITQRAARRIGWNPSVVAWANRLLIVAGIALLIATVVRFVA